MKQQENGLVKIVERAKLFVWTACEKGGHTQNLDMPFIYFSTDFDRKRSAKRKTKNKTRAARIQAKCKTTDF